MDTRWHFSGVAGLAVHPCGQFDAVEFGPDVVTSVVRIVCGTLVVFGVFVAAVVALPSLLAWYWQTTVL